MMASKRRELDLSLLSLLFFLPLPPFLPNPLPPPRPRMDSTQLTSIQPTRQLQLNQPLPKPPLPLHHSQPSSPSPEPKQVEQLGYVCTFVPPQPPKNPFVRSSVRVGKSEEREKKRKTTREKKDVRVSTLPLPPPLFPPVWVVSVWGLGLKGLEETERPSWTGAVC